MSTEQGSASASATDAVGALRGRLEGLLTGYSLSAVLFAAAELRLFSHLAGGPATVGALAERMGAAVAGVARLCTALTALGLLERGADGSFAAVPGAVALLGGDGPGSLLPTILHHQRHIAPLLARLPDAVRHARPQHAVWSFASPDAASRHCYEELAAHAAEYELFLEAMDRSSVGVGDDIARAFDLRDVRRLIDLGGGGGQVARELLAAAPHLTIEMVDLPIACALAERRARDAGVGGRFRATPADFVQTLPRDAIAPGDVVLLSGILADWSPDDGARILANAASLLRPGGVLLVSETLLDDTRTGPVVPAILSLIMLVVMPGDSFTRPELAATLERAGFSVVDHKPPRASGRRDLLVARR